MKYAKKERSSVPGPPTPIPSVPALVSLPRFKQGEEIFFM